LNKKKFFAVFISEAANFPIYCQIDENQFPEIFKAAPPLQDFRFVGNYPFTNGRTECATTIQIHPSQGTH